MEAGTLLGKAAVGRMWKGGGEGENENEKMSRQGRIWLPALWKAEVVRVAQLHHPLPKASGFILRVTK